MAKVTLWWVKANIGARNDTGSLILNPGQSLSHGVTLDFDDSRKQKMEMYV